MPLHPRIMPGDPDADFKMMKNPDHWPMFPRLPLKHKTERIPGNWPKHAVLECLYLTQDFPMRFYEGKTMYDKLYPEEATRVINAEADLRALVEAGWIVD